MLDTSALYKNIISGTDFWYESKLVVDGVGTFDESQLVSISTHHDLFGTTPTVGTAIAGEINVEMLYPAVDLPTMACMRPFVRACDRTRQSEWLPQGVFFIDTRSRDKDDTGLSKLIIHGYDAMLKAEQLYNGRITGDSTDIQMVNEIAYQMGTTVDPRTTAMMTAAYRIPLPVGFTYRETLGYIASMYAGCFIISEEGKLRLIALYELPPQTHYLIDNIGNPITFGGIRILV